VISGWPFFVLPLPLFWRFGAFDGWNVPPGLEGTRQDIEELLLYSTKTKPAPKCCHLSRVVLYYPYSQWPWKGSTPWNGRTGSTPVGRNSRDDDLPNRGRWQLAQAAVVRVCHFVQVTGALFDAALCALLLLSLEVPMSATLIRLVLYLAETVLLLVVGYRRSKAPDWTACAASVQLGRIPICYDHSGNAI